MSEDTLLKTLASRVREQQPDDRVDDALWDQYAAGELSEEELHDLLSRTSSSDAEKMQAAFAPLDQAFKGQLVSSATEQLAKGGPGIDEEVKVESDKVVSIESRRSKFFAPLAVAATLLLAIGTWQLGFQTQGHLPLPAYELAVLGGSEFRSTDTAVTLPEFAAGDRLEIRLTPATAIDSTVEGRVYAQTSQVLMPLESMDFELAPTGAARISGRIGDAVLLNSGTNTLVVVVGQEDRLPDEAKLFRLFEQSGPLERVLLGDGWQAWRVPLVFEALPK